MLEPTLKRFSFPLSYRVYQHSKSILLMLLRTTESPLPAIKSPKHELEEQSRNFKQDNLRQSPSLHLHKLHV